MSTKIFNWRAPHRIERLEQLAADKMTGKEIAAALQAEFGEACTRMSVIGKCNRMGIMLQSGLRHGRPGSVGGPLEDNHAPAAPRAPRVRKPKERAPMEAQETENTPSPIVAVFGAANELFGHSEGFATAGKSIMELRDIDCRWITNDYPAHEAVYCGERISRGSYCEAHAALVWIPRRPEGRNAERERFVVLGQRQFGARMAHGKTGRAA